MDVLVQPANSQIEVDDFADGLTVRVPPAGLWKGSSGLFTFGLLWCGFMVVFDGIAVTAMLTDGRKQDGLWVLVGVSALFWLVGVLMLLAAVNMGRRKAAIAIAGGQLMAIQTGIFGTKKQEWAVDQVASIAAGPSGMEVNKRPVLELQIISSGSAKFGMLCGRSDEELRWLAQLLRREIPRLRDEDESSVADDNDAAAEAGE